MAVAKHWVVTADGYRARVFEWNPAEQSLKELVDLTHPRSRLQGRDLVAEPEGRSAGTSERGRGDSVPARTDPHEHEEDRFARAVSEHLAQALQEARYGRLSLIAEPRFLGRLRRHLNDQVRSSIVEEVHSDLSELDPRSLATRLQLRR